MILRPYLRARPARVAALTAALVLASPGRFWAHDIPSSVALMAYIKPEPHRLRLVVRVPLEAMRDVNFPLKPGAAEYLQLGARLDSLLDGAATTWLANEIEMYENGSALAAGRVIAHRVALQSDRAFESYEHALSHVLGPPLDPETDLSWRQAMFDVLLEYPIGSEQSRFDIDPRLARLGVRTTSVLRFLPPGGGERDFQYMGDPGRVHLDPRWFQAAWRFIQLGFSHILDGIDHLLFVVCLVIPFRKLRPLIAIVTSFTVAHSITLIASAMGYAPDALWFPPFIEVLIALSIVYMALENIIGPKLERRWMIAFGFGLVHGFGFSFALRESLQFAGSHLATSLFAFNVGVELGQLVVLCVAIPALALLFKRVVAERTGTILLSALVAHTAWHWMLDRWTLLLQYQLTWPAWDLALLASAMRAAMVLLIISGAAWAMLELYRRLQPAPSSLLPPPESTK